MYYRWPVTAAQTGFVVIPFLLQWVQNVMDLTTRRFVFPAFRQPQQNKNQPLEGLKATVLAVFFASETSFSTETTEFVYHDEDRGVRVLFSG